MKFKSALILILVSLTLPACSLFKKKTSEPVAKTKSGITEPVNIIDVGQRPHLTITPNTSGRELTLAIAAINKSATEAEYELEYQSGDLLLGAFGSFDIDTAKLPLTKDILLGSCSAGGSCTYHENVQGGTLTMKFSGGDDTYAIKTEWRFIPTKGASGLFSSRDSKFQMNAGKLLDTSGFVIVMDTSGLPATIEGELLSEPYGLYPASGLPKKGTAELKIRLKEDVTSATIHGYDGTKWVSFDTTVADKTASATVDFFPAYIVTK